MNRSDELLCFENICFRYNEGTSGDRTVLEDVTFSLTRESGLVALIGPNGSGKTTAFRLITGQLMPNRGRILMCGSDVTDEPSHKRRGLGCVFQRATDGMCSTLTIEENLCLMLLDDRPSFLRPLVTPSRKDYILSRAQEIAGIGDSSPSLLYDLEGILKRYPAEFSGGETQQLCLLSLLLQEKPASLVLADEPTLNLDRDNRQICIEMLSALSRRVTVLLATHDKELIGRCVRIMKLEQGRIVQDPEESPGMVPPVGGQQ